MTAFTMSDPASRPPSQASGERQLDWQLLDVGDARAKLASMDAESLVLLVGLDDLELEQPIDQAGWEKAFVRSVLSRVGPPPPEVLRGPAGLELQPSSRLAFCGGEELNLTSTEFSLLQELLSRDGAVISVDELSRTIWGHETLGAPNYVEAHISRLRRKLRDVGAGRVIETVRGAGYRVRRARADSSPMAPFLAGPQPSSAGHLSGATERDAA